MGYYITMDKSTISVPKEKQDEAYKALCDLNLRNDLKTGGSWPRPDDIEGPNPYVWFSWMEWDYPEKYSNLREVLTAVGFEVQETDDELRVVYYDDKTGCEYVFLAALAPFMTDGCYSEWRGEDGEEWRHEYRDGRVFGMERIKSWGPPTELSILSLS